MIRLQPMIVGVFNFMNVYKNKAKFLAYQREQEGIRLNRFNNRSTYILYSETVPTLGEGGDFNHKS
jgi:hypothetical protein